jgi:hypothetical protein
MPFLDWMNKNRPKTSAKFQDHCLPVPLDVGSDNLARMLNTDW